MRRLALNRTIVVGVLAIALLLVCLTMIVQNFGNALEQSSKNELGEPEPVTFERSNISTVIPSPVPENSAISSPPEVKKSDIKSSGLNYYSTDVQQATVKENVMVDETFLISAINALGATGGQIVLESNLSIMKYDVYIPSNIVLSGANPNITIFLVGGNIRVATRAVNVTLKDLTIDASGLGEHYCFVDAQNTTNVILNNIDFYNYDGPGCLLVMGDQVVLNNLSFTNVTERFPIQIFGSNVTVRDCNSNDNSSWALIAVGGGISDITIVGNSAVNRPLINANYGSVSTKNLSIENNTVYFPNGTYGLLVMGGMGYSVQAPYQNVTVKGNFLRAGPGGWNAIAIYGLTTDALVMNNTVDMSLSGHNGIGISSGINVTVMGNVVFGCTELTEGGIEVESNPMHNRNVGFSENVTVVDNTVYNSSWGVYVRVMCPDHPNWNGTILLSKNILIENNFIFDCGVGVNLLYGDSIIVRNNSIASNVVPFAVNIAEVFNFTVTGNLGYP